MRWSIVLLAAAVAAGCLGGPGDPRPTPCRPDLAALAPASAMFDAIRFSTTEGDIDVVLYNQSAPETVALMQDFVREGYYVGRSFMRIVPGHVIQVTDAAGGATDDPRRVPLEVHPAFPFGAGAAGIARGEDPGSGGPEFFLMDFATSHLHGNYTVWGQVVSGLDVVRRIARGPAYEAPRVPPQVPELNGTLLGTTDRMALEPATILDARLLRLEAADGSLPRQVATNVRSGDFRHSLEWPASTAAGHAAAFTWYVRGYNGTAPPDPASLEVRAGNATLSVLGDPDVPGIYSFHWAPPHCGDHPVQLMQAGRVLATLWVRL